MYKLRPKQVEAVKNIQDFINSEDKNHGIFVYPTSFGKSLVICELASKFPNKYFINVATSKELLSQNYNKFTNYGLTANLCSNSLGEVSVGKITFATIGTISKFSKFFKDKDVVIIDDEAHESSAKGSQLDKFVKKLKNYKLIGVTATPFRLVTTLDGSMLKLMDTDKDCIYNSIESVVQISEVVTDGYWSKLTYYSVDLYREKLKLNTTKTDYTDESLKEFNVDNDLINNIVNKVERLKKYGRKSILISVPFIEDATALEEILKDCKAVYSGMDASKRDSVISDFKSLKLSTLVQCKILSVGFDHPELDTIIAAKPSNSLTFYYQLLGRGVRIHENKKDCIVLDMSGNYSKFGDIANLNFEYIDGYGWGLFSGEKLLTDVVLDDKEDTTKDYLKLHKKPKTCQFYFNEDVDGSPKISFGKNKGCSLKYLYFRKRYYLKFLIEKNYQFCKEDEEFERQLKEIFK